MNILVNLRLERIISNPLFIHELIKAGVQIFRINAAFGNPQDWLVIQTAIRQANMELGSSAKLLVDLAGPKNRVEKLYHEARSVSSINLFPGQEIFLSNSDVYSGFPLVVCKDYDFVRPSQIGHLIRLDDARVELEVIGKMELYLRLRVNRFFGVSDYSLSIGKGINFPHIQSDFVGLSEKDQFDLSQAAKFTDVISFSFTKSAADIHYYRNELLRIGLKAIPMNIKIETRQAVEQLEDLVLACSLNQPSTLMIARGDLVSECGITRLGFIQDQIIRLAKTHSIPVYLATGVLDSFIKHGELNRSEFSDLHHLRSLDGFLLDDGPYLLEGIDLLKSCLQAS